MEQSKNQVARFIMKTYQILQVNSLFIQELKSKLSYCLEFKLKTVLNKKCIGV